MKNKPAALVSEIDTKPGGMPEGGLPIQIHFRIDVFALWVVSASPLLFVLYLAFSTVSIIPLLIAARNTGRRRAGEIGTISPRKLAGSRLN